MYHAIGDSACIYNFAFMPEFTIHHLGSVRMRDAAEHGTGLLDIRRLNVQPGDKCFFTFGEIDVRCDVYTQTLTGGNEDDLLAELAGGYLETLHRNRMDGVEFWIIAILPTAYVKPIPVEIRNHPLFPYIGPDDARARYTVKLNQQVRQQGEAIGFRYLDVFSSYADERNMLRPELASYMHAADNRPVRNAMREAGLIAIEAESPSAANIIDRWKEKAKGEAAGKIEEPAGGIINESRDAA